jgi:hypothetical protein
MGITITAETLHDALAKLERGETHYGIKIRWRKGDQLDYMPSMLTGCIVNAVGMPGQEVERSFATAGEALRYIATLLKMVDSKAREQKKERAKKDRERARKLKRCPGDSPLGKGEK